MLHLKDCFRYALTMIVVFDGMCSFNLRELQADLKRLSGGRSPPTKLIVTKDCLPKLSYAYKNSLWSARPPKEYINCISATFGKPSPLTFKNSSTNMYSASVNSTKHVFMFFPVGGSPAQTPPLSRPGGLRD